MRFEPGQKIKEYTLEEPLGGGASGEVWKAIGENKQVAIKFMNENLLRHPNALKHRERMQREIDALRDLEHPNIPRLYESDLDFTPPYLVMEYVGAESYDRLIESGKILDIPIKRRLEVIQALAFALHTAHSHDIIHRDIKPGNIAGVDTPRLLDFSVAVEMNGISSTQSGIGTEAYMDPDPDSRPDTLGDIYSFAVVCFQIIFLHHPIFTDLDMEQRRRLSTSLGWERIRTGEWQQPSTLLKQGKLPSGLEHINIAQVDAIFAKGLGLRSQRYTDPVTFAEELRSAIILTTPEEVSSVAGVVPQLGQSNVHSPSVYIPSGHDSDIHAHLDPLKTVAEIIPSQSTRVEPVKPPTLPNLAFQLESTLRRQILLLLLKWRSQVLSLAVKWREQFMRQSQNVRIGITTGAILTCLLLFVVVRNISYPPPTSVLNTVSPTTNPSTVVTSNSCPGVAEAIQAANKGVASNEDWKPFSCVINGIEMILVPSGTFEFGYWTDNGKPIKGNPVKVENAYWLAKYETSNQLFDQYVTDRSVKLLVTEVPSPGPSLPREVITWEEARDYCRATDMQLPTEAQWEYAARGPNNLLYPWGDALPSSSTWTSNDGYVNYCDSSCKSLVTDKTDTTLDKDFRQKLDQNVLNARFDDGHTRTAPIDSFPAGRSWVGAYNMSGNVSEWTSTILQIKQGTSNVPLDSYPYNPFDQFSGVREDLDRRVQSRVIRGGSYIANLITPFHVPGKLPNSISSPTNYESVTTYWRQSVAQWQDLSKYYRIGVRCAMDMAQAQVALGISQ